MDMASVGYTWLAIVHGSPYGEAPWDDEVTRTRWLQASAALFAVDKVATYLGQVYDQCSAQSIGPLGSLYHWCVEVSLDHGCVCSRLPVTIVHGLGLACVCLGYALGRTLLHEAVVVVVVIAHPRHRTTILVRVVTQ
jgi:hypothetical protein